MYVWCWQIVVLQDKLKREGKLRTQGDVDQFWRDIRRPEVFYQHFKVSRNGEISQNFIGDKVSLGIGALGMRCST